MVVTSPISSAGIGPVAGGWGTGSGTEVTMAAGAADVRGVRPDVPCSILVAIAASLAGVCAGFFRRASSAVGR